MTTTVAPEPTAAAPSPSRSAAVRRQAGPAHRRAVRQPRPHRRDRRPRRPRRGLAAAVPVGGRRRRSRPRRTRPRRPSPGSARRLHHRGLRRTCCAGQHPALDVEQPADRRRRSRSSRSRCRRWPPTRSRGSTSPAGAGCSAAIIASIIIPPQVLIVPLFYEMLTLNLVDTYWGRHPAAGGRTRRWCSS